MSEPSTRLRIAMMLRNIGAITKPHLEIPRVLQDADLPAAVVFPGEATYDTDTLGDQMVYETRTYDVVLYVANAVFDTQGALEIKADPFFAAIRDYFLARPGLELDAEGSAQTEVRFNSRLLGDGGLQVGPYPLGGTKDYIQIRFRLRVEEIAAVTYHD